MISVVERKYWNQLRNGELFADNVSDFTNYLLGSIGEKIKAQFTIDVYWYSVGQPYVDDWSAISSGGFCTVIRKANSFLKDEFRVGDTVYWTDSYYGTGTGTIISVNDLEMIFSESSGHIDDLQTGNGFNGLHNQMRIYGTTVLTGGLYKYNLIENSDPISFNSKIDGSTMSFAGDGYSNTDTQLIAQGSFMSWQDDGIVTIKTATSGSPYKQRFIVTHEFWITPLYLPTQNSDLKAGIPPAYLKGAKNLKYIFDIELRESLYNPNISHAGRDSIMLGDCSWFNEHFDGFNPIEFSKESIVYTVDGIVTGGINTNSITHIAVEVNSVNNLFSNANTKFCLNFFTLPVEDSEFKELPTSMFDNFLFDQCFSTIGAAAGTGIKGLMSNVVATIVSNRMHIEFDIEFTPAQVSKAPNREYVISVITDSHIEPHVSSKEVQVLFDLGSFANQNDADIPDLLFYRPAKFWEHPWTMSLANSGYKNFRGWVSDGVFYKTLIGIVEEVTLNRVAFKIRAYNSYTQESFDLMNYDIDLTPFPIQNGYRQVFIDTSRGFKLITGSRGNYVKLANNNSREYDFEFGFKLRWEDWIQLLSAHSDFFNFTDVNNGQNHRWSNYFNKVSGWSLQMVNLCTVEMVWGAPLGVKTDYEMISELDVHDFGEDGNIPPIWVGGLETFKGASSLGTDGNAKIDSVVDTKIVVTWTANNSISSNNLYGIIMIGGYDVDGIYTQHQISTAELPAANCWLKPVTGQTKCKMTVFGNKVYLEAMVDVTKVSGNQTIMSRIGYNCQGEDEIQASSDIQLPFINNHALLLVNQSESFDVVINGVVYHFECADGYDAIIQKIFDETGYTLYVSGTI